MDPESPVVSSVHNQWVRFARSLGHRKARLAERAFVVEGTRLVSDAVAAGATPRVVFYDPDVAAASSLARRLADVCPGTRLIPVTKPVMRALSDTETPQGIVAIVPLPDIPIRVKPEAPLLCVIADAVRDPGNVGTLIRSAAGAGADAFFASPGTAYPFSPKVVRAGTGAHFRLPIRPLDWSRPDPVLLACRQRLATSTAADVPYDAVDWTHPTCLIVGNEAVGLSEAARAFSTGAVSIPLAAGIDSLNAAVAGSVVLFEAARQRRLGGAGRTSS